MIAEIFAKYLDLFPEDRSKLKLLDRQIKRGDDLGSRQNYTGHVTGSAIIFSPDTAKILLIYHPTFGAWQQPGGHWERAEAGPWLTAEREAVEETGFKLAHRLDLPDSRVPIQIDSHLVPTKPPKNEPPHHHHDFRYVFLAADESLKMDDLVIKQARWVDVSNVSDQRLVVAAARAKKFLNLKA